MRRGKQSNGCRKIRFKQKSTKSVKRYCVRCGCWIKTVLACGYCFRARCAGCDNTCILCQARDDFCNKLACQFRVCLQLGSDQYCCAECCQCKLAQPKPLKIQLNDDCLITVLSFVTNYARSWVLLGQVCQNWNKLAHNPQIVSRLQLKPYSTAHLPRIARLTPLRYLDLSVAHALFSDDSILTVSSLTALTHLRLSWDRCITHVGLQTVARCFQGLTFLDLSYCGGVNELGMESLCSLSSLQVLDLFNCGLSDASVKKLSYLTSIEDLVLGGNPITNTGLSVLHTLTALRSLNIRGCDVTDESIISLQQLSQLSRLIVSECEQVTDRVLPFLSKSLRKLGLSNSGCLATRVGLESIAKFSLVFLEMQACPHQDMSILSTLTLLTSLRLGPATNLEAIGFFTNLKELGFVRQHDLRLDVLSELPSLSILQLQECKFQTSKLPSRSGEELCIGLGNLTHLVDLRLSDNLELVDATLLDMSRLSKLEHLSLYTLGITDATMNLLQYLPRLVYLDLVACEAVSDVSVAMLQKQSVTVFRRGSF